GEDPIAVLAQALPPGIRDDVVGLRRKADDELRPVVAAPGDRGKDVRVFDEAQHRRAAAVLLQLVLVGSFDAPVGDVRRHHRDIDGERRLTAGQHLRGRPDRHQPYAGSPKPGPTRLTPRASSVAKLACAAGWAHIIRFIVGAISTGLSEASNAVVARSSAAPVAIRAIRSALAGATTTRSASRDNRIWPISLSSVSDQRSV